MASIHLFIDSSSWLSLYHFTKDDLQKLQRVNELIDKGKITLYVPEQTRDEVKRNRDEKIIDAMKRFREAKIPDQFPQLCKDYAEHPELVELVDRYRAVKSKLTKQVDEDIAGYTLKADQVIHQLLDKGRLIQRTSVILQAARDRHDVGNPPGKGKSLGDEINWESLLSAVPQGSDLHLIARDGDYAGNIDDKACNSYLKQEWRTKKGGDVRLYILLTEFFNANFPDVKLASETEEDRLIEKLEAEGLIAPSARDTLAKLAACRELTQEQIDRIVEVGLNRNNHLSVVADSLIRFHLRQILQGRDIRQSSQLAKDFKAIVGVK
jgi:hypothetical protein